MPPIAFATTRHASAAVPPSRTLVINASHSTFSVYLQRSAPAGAEKPSEPSEADKSASQETCGKQPQEQRNNKLQVTPWYLDSFAVPEGGTPADNDNIVSLPLPQTPDSSDTNGVEGATESELKTSPNTTDAPSSSDRLNRPPLNQTALLPVMPDPVPLQLASAWNRREHHFSDCNSITQAAMNNVTPLSPSQLDQQPSLSQNVVASSANGAQNTSLPGQTSDDAVAGTHLTAVQKTTQDRTGILTGVPGQQAAPVLVHLDRAWNRQRHHIPENLRNEEPISDASPSSISKLDSPPAPSLTPGRLSAGPKSPDAINRQSVRTLPSVRSAMSITYGTTHVETAVPRGTVSSLPHSAALLMQVPLPTQKVSRIVQPEMTSTPKTNVKASTENSKMGDPGIRLRHSSWHPVSRCNRSHRIFPSFRPRREQVTIRDAASILEAVGEAAVRYFVPDEQKPGFHCSQ